MSRPRTLTVLAVAVVLTVSVAAAPAVVADPGGSEPVTYVPPVDAPISDPFRPPASPYGRGNRGLEYDVAVGDVVRAAAAGTVTFNGQVAGRLHVTLLHADGLRTTYGPLARIAPGVTRGAVIEAGDAVGTAGGRVLWTARLGRAYVDPGVLLSASGTTTVRLVPDRRSPRTPLGAH